MQQPSLMRIAPDLRSLCELMPTMPFTTETLPAIRESMTAMIADQRVRPLPGITWSEYYVPGPLNAPAVRVSCFVPAATRQLRPAVLEIHGGGYVAGAADMGHLANAELAAALDSVVVSVDYRLAPETPCPGPLEDCYAALRWMFGEGAELLGIDTQRIAISGVSAGGGLAAALALLARDRSEFPLVMQILSMPMLDDRTVVRRDMAPTQGEFIWTAAHNAFGWQSYLGEAGAAEIHPYGAAARCQLTDLPATFIAVGALDLFLDENLDYARRLAHAGVPVELQVYPGAIHAFGLIPTSRAAINFREASRAALKGVFYG